jgi:hypothetical protein
LPNKSPKPEQPIIGSVSLLRTSIHSKVVREDILRSRSNLAERLGFLGRLIHGLKPGAWLKDLNARVGEPLDYAEASVR